jgi:hypothetical protein
VPDEAEIEEAAGTGNDATVADRRQEEGRIGHPVGESGPEEVAKRRCVHAHHRGLGVKRTGGGGATNAEVFAANLI